MKFTSSRATVQNEIRRLYKSNWEAAIPEWPPDVFALACYLLRHSGAYHQVVENWPPVVKGSKLTWKDFVSSLGERWRQDESTKPPKAVQEWWRQLASHAKTPLVEIASNRNLCELLLQLLAVSDEACRNFGIRGEEPTDFAAVEAWTRLNASDTLCRLIDPGMVCCDPLGSNTA